MRLTSRPTRSPAARRQERARCGSAEAVTFAESFPKVDRLRLKLSFTEPTGVGPVGQLHDLFPPTAAVVEFSCPYGDCDGSFDLTEGVAIVLRKEALEGAGLFQCRGTRTASGMTRQPCTLRLTYHLTVTYHAITE